MHTCNSSCHVVQTLAVWLACVGTCGISNAQGSFWTAPPMGQAAPESTAVIATDPNIDVLQFMQAGDFATAERVLRDRLDLKRPDYVNVVQLLAVSLVYQGRAQEALAELDAGIAWMPSSIDLKVLGFEILRDVLDDSRRAPDVARRIAQQVPLVATSDAAGASDACRRLVAAAVEPELLVPLMQAAVQMAEMQGSAYRGLEDHMGYLREAASDLDRAAACVRARDWQQARGFFESAASWVEYAARGFPRQDAVLRPMLKAAAGASSVLCGDVSRAESLCREGSEVAAIPEQQAVLMTVLAVCSGLSGSDLDIGSAGSIEDQAAAARSWQAQADAATSSLPTNMYLDSVSSSMLWNH